MMFRLRRISIYRLMWLIGGFYCLALVFLIGTIISSTAVHQSKDNALALLASTYGDIYQLTEDSGSRFNADDLDTLVWVLSPDQRQLMLGPQHWPLPEVLSIGTHAQVLKSREPTLADIHLSYLVKSMPDGRYLIVGQDRTALNRQHSTPMWIPVFILSSLALACLGSFFIGYFILRRLQRINHSCRHIIETKDLTKRLSHDGSNKDFDALASNLNQMLAQIQQLMADVRQVSDDIAHDLRTPLTRMKNKLDSLNNTALPVEVQQQTVDSLRAEADNLLNIFNALLRITNIEHAHNPGQWPRVAIDGLVRDVVELYEPLASDKRHCLRLALEPVSAMVDGDLLFQALANVVDNAVKYTPAGGEIVISLDSTEEQLCIGIADNGIGVDGKELNKLTRRFYRAEKSRNLCGNGLGLSMVDAIVKLHGGALRLSQAAPGLVVEILLPLPPRDSGVKINKG